MNMKEGIIIIRWLSTLSTILHSDFVDAEEPGRPMVTLSQLYSTSRHTQSQASATNYIPPQDFKISA